MITIEAEICNPFPQTQASIAEAYENGSGYKAILDTQSCIDENTISSIVRSFRLHWWERLRSQSLRLYPLRSLIRSCFAFFRSLSCR